VAALVSGAHQAEGEKGSKPKGGSKAGLTGKYARKTAEEKEEEKEEEVRVVAKKHKHAKQAAVAQEAEAEGQEGEEGVEEGAVVKVKAGKQLVVKVVEVGRCRMNR